MGSQSDGRRVVSRQARREADECDRATGVAGGALLAGCRAGADVCGFA
jgi:hypothetical protein